MSGVQNCHPRGELSIILRGESTTISQRTIASPLDMSRKCIDFLKQNGDFPCIQETHRATELKGHNFRFPCSSHHIIFVQPVTLCQRALVLVTTWQHQLLRKKRTRNSERSRAT